MKGDSLYDVVDFILNQASENDLEVIRAALKRRIEGSDMAGPMGVSPLRLARESAAKVRRQVGVSVERIRETVKQFAAEIIRKNAPELTEAQVKELLDTWVPTGAGEAEPESAVSEGAPAGAAGHPAALKDGKLPPEALISMIAQFMAYSTESMSITEQVRLRDEIPDWHKRYWEQFSPRVRSLISLHIGGQLDRDTFWERIRLELGVESGGSP
jgi:hypothetical protein